MAPALCVAAHYAFQDAIRDHAGGESVYGEIFNAVVESCAFVIDDKFELISLGLSAIPASCKTHRAITRTLELYHQGRSGSRPGRFSRPSSTALLPNTRP